MKLVSSMGFLLSFHFFLSYLFLVNLFIYFYCIVNDVFFVGFRVVAQAESCISLVIYSVPSSISCSCFNGIFKLISLSIFSLKAVQSVLL